MKVLYYLLALFVFLHSGSAVTEYYVRTNTTKDCPSKPCLTLNDYADDSEKYFTSNTDFISLDGEHYLEIPLVILGQINISMNGTPNVSINLSPYATILFGFFFFGINFFAFNKADKGGAIYIEDSVAVFNGTNTFRENRGSPGKLNLEPDAFHVKNSPVAFQGEVNFIGNLALFGGSSDVSGVFWWLF